MRLSCCGRRIGRTPPGREKSSTPKHSYWNGAVKTQRLIFPIAIGNRTLYGSPLMTTIVWPDIVRSVAETAPLFDPSDDEI
jgi:hypothetical protein